MGYTAGTLDLSILGASDNAVASIDKTVKSLNSLSRAITKIYNLPVLGSANNLSMFFQKIADATSRIDTSKLSDLAASARGLSSISNLSKLDKMNWSAIGSGFSTLTTAITPFITKVKEAEASLTALYGILNKSSGKKIGGLLNGVGSTTKSAKSFKNPLSGILRLGSWTAVLYTARRLGRVMGDIVTAGSDFGETLNLWKVAMGDEFLPQATEFVNKLNEAYGISKETLMNSQAIFKNMLGSLGEISGEQAYQLSEGITQMALDYASLYNVQFEDAMTKFQAALAGQVRPIRSVSGYDITENTLFQLYQELGGTKTMRQLSRTEKQLLAIYAVFEQMGRSGATGDLERTINSFANQSRVMADSWKDVKTYAGLTVTRLLESMGVMKYVNAMLIFLSRLLEGVATSLDTGLGESGDVFGDMENGVTDTTEAVEELQGALLDFDKFRALDQTSTVSDTLGIDETILDAMTKYDSILENANLEARELADSWLKSLGFVDENNDGIIDMQNGIDDLVDKVKNIDWNIVGSKFNDALQSVLDWLISVLSNSSWWADLGKNMASAINGINLGDTLLKALGIISLIAEGLANAIYNALVNIDWQKLFEDIIKKPLKDAFTNALDWVNSLDIPNWNDIGKAIAIWWNNLFADDATEIIIPGFANGGLPDKGSVFYAGEAGAEIVYNTASGQSGVANVRQIEQAMFNALARYGQQGGENIVVQAYLDGEKVYENTTSRAKSRGYVWAKA